MNNLSNRSLYPVLQSNDGVFNARSGQLIDLNNPQIETILLEDIATGLMNQCRFGGQTSKHYSVLLHSFLVASLAPADLKLEAMLHDAAEAYLGDVIKPLKNLLGTAYTDVEDRFMRVISKKFGLCPDKLSRIKAFDIAALKLEYKAFMYDEKETEGWIKRLIEHEIGTPLGSCVLNDRLQFIQYVEDRL